MIRNLFSIFDPTTEINDLPLNWTRIAIGLLLIPTRIWLIPSRNRIIMRLLINKLHQEIKTVLRKGNENKGNLFILFIILTNNFLGLFPYILTRTRHLTLTLTLALPLWMRFILFGWIKNIPIILQITLYIVLWCCFLFGCHVILHIRASYGVQSLPILNHLYILRFMGALKQAAVRRFPVLQCVC